MDQTVAIHTAARRYCLDRSVSWQRAYAELGARDGIKLPHSDGKWSYTTEAQDIFPRYQTLAAILSEIERFVPEDFTSLEDARSILEIAAETAQSSFTNFTEPVMRAADEEERRLFSHYIRTVGESCFAAQTSLPFRRVLGVEEHKQLHIALAQRWGKWYGGSVNSDAGSSNTLTLHVGAMDIPGSYASLHSIFSDRNILRALELREWGDGYEIETQAASFLYNGAEGFWSVRDLDWFVYASHESSITFGGDWLIGSVRKLLPGLERYVYRGWDLALYR